MLSNLATLRNRKTGRSSSWDKSGRNFDLWIIPPGETAVLADITGPAQITHIWMTQVDHYRECLIKITYDNESQPSVLCTESRQTCPTPSCLNCPATGTHASPWQQAAKDNTANLSC